MSEPIVLHVGKQEVQVIPSALHEYVMTTEQVALGYGVGQENIRQHKATKRDELAEGKHWLTVSNPNGGADLTYWTKRGVIRLGFFIRSARAKKFRDMAEDLVLQEVAPAPVQPDFSALERLAGLTARAIEVKVEAKAVEILAEVDHRFSALPIRGQQISEVFKRAVKLGELMGGSSSDRAKAWRAFKDRFNLASYRDLPEREYETALAFLDAQIVSYAAPATLKFG